MADDATERLLKEQARAHGLDAYAPEPEGVAPKTIAYAIRQENEKDEAALRGFAGLRGGASSSFERKRGKEERAPRPLYATSADKGTASRRSPCGRGKWPRSGTSRRPSSSGAARRGKAWCAPRQKVS